MQIDFSQLSQEQKQKIQQHLTDFKKDPNLLDGVDQFRLDEITTKIRRGDSIDDDIDSHMLAVYIANTYTGNDGPDWFQYLVSLGLPQDLF